MPATRSSTGNSRPRKVPEVSTTTTTTTMKKTTTRKPRPGGVKKATTKKEPAKKKAKAGVMAKVEGAMDRAKGTVEGKPGKKVGE